MMSFKSSACRSFVDTNICRQIMRISDMSLDKINLAFPSVSLTLVGKLVHKGPHSVIFHTCTAPPRQLKEFIRGG